MRRAPRIRSLAAGTALLLVSALFAPSGAAGTGRDRPAEPCDGLVALEVAGATLCTHGGDAAPNLPAAARLRSASAPGAPCPGDGTSARRVRVLYGYPAGTKDRSSALQADIRLSLRIADGNLDGQTPGTKGQHYRYWCRTDTGPTIEAVKLRRSARRRILGRRRDRLARRPSGARPGRAQLRERQVRVLTFVDHLQGVSAPAGQATFLGDDRPDPATNRNNDTSQMRYGMVTLGYPAATEAACSSTRSDTCSAPCS